MINPELAESQLHGGIILGLHEYKIPTHADIPEIDARIISVADAAANHVGVKGLAEPPIIPTAPAIANAAFDAIGVQITELPLTPARVLAAFSERR